MRKLRNSSVQRERGGWREEVIELLRFIAEQMKLKDETTKEISEDE